MPEGLRGTSQLARRVPHGVEPCGWRPPDLATAEGDSFQGRYCGRRHGDAGRVHHREAARRHDAAGETEGPRGSVWSGAGSSRASSRRRTAPDLDLPFDRRRFSYLVERGRDRIVPGVPPRSSVATLLSTTRYELQLRVSCAKCLGATENRTTSFRSSVSSSMLSTVPMPNCG